MFESLLEKVRDYYARDIRKHGLADDVDAEVDRRINALTNVELVSLISMALEDGEPNLFPSPKGVDPRPQFDAD
jgi:hypothetical protein